ITSTSVYNQTRKIYNISTDERGSSRWALDDVGNVMAKTSYDAWGSVTENNAVSLSPYIEDINLTESFTGYLYDEGTGLWNAGARTYDPETKRFLSEDPESGTMDDPISTVKYVYAYDNPVMNVDPDGRSVWGTITSWGSKAYDTAKSWAGTAVNAVKKTAGYVKDKVVQGVQAVKQAGRKMIDAAASYVQKVICMIPDGVKKVWNDINKLYDKIPNSVKFTIGAAGVAVAVVTGAAPLGAAVGVLAGAMLGGAAMNAGIYAAGAFFGYHNFSWKEMGKTAIDGAADGALFAGVGMIAKSVTYAVKNPEPLKAFLADETGGEINLSKFGKTGHGKSSGKIGADNVADAARLKEYYKQAENYGTGSIKELENGRFRFYEKIKPARKKGEMAGARHVREWDPYSDFKRDWYETVDYNGKIRQVRPDPNITGGVKVHYTFDNNGNYTGSWIPKK
ncbi:MAG: RHS repeat-associated core domain-containing protein, partial [Eubacterium sp.]|nr:RHS repeat-associated core domain-containing protein [Eubacterium sp.]